MTYIRPTGPARDRLTERKLWTGYENSDGAEADHHARRSECRALAHYLLNRMKQLQGRTAHGDFWWIDGMPEREQRACYIDKRFTEMLEMAIRYWTYDDHPHPR
jgi:hypothetical protein